MYYILLPIPVIPAARTAISSTTTAIMTFLEYRDFINFDFLCVENRCGEEIYTCLE